MSCIMGITPQAHFQLAHDTHSLELEGMEVFPCNLNILPDNEPFYASTPSQKRDYQQNLGGIQNAL